MYKIYIKISLLLSVLITSQSVKAQEDEADTIFVNVSRETRVILSSKLIKRNFENAANGLKFDLVPQSANSFILTPKEKTNEPVNLIVQEEKRYRKFVIVYKENVKKGDAGDFEYDYSSKDADELQASDNTVLTLYDAPQNLKEQASSIPYSAGELMQVKAKYAKFDLTAYPPGQGLNLPESTINRQVCEELMAAKPRMNLLYANNAVNISLVCQGISFDENNNAYLKLLIQNTGDMEFLTGTMQLTWMRKKDGNKIKLYPGYIFVNGRYLPMVQPGSQISLIYPFKAYNISDDDNLKFELHDRAKKINVEFTLPGSEYNKERKR